MDIIDGLYVQEKVAYDMWRSAKTKKEKDYYANELMRIRGEIEKYLMRREVEW